MKLNPVTGYYECVKDDFDGKRTLQMSKEEYNRAVQAFAEKFDMSQEEVVKLFEDPNGWDETMYGVTIKEEQ